MHVAEADEHDDGDDGEAPEEQEALQTVQENDPGDGMEDDEEFQQLQSMLETMATELDEAAAAGCDEDELNGLEEKMDDAVETLVTLREARSQISALKKDRGYHGGKPSNFKNNNKV